MASRGGLELNFLEYLLFFARKHAELEAVFEDREEKDILRNNLVAFPPSISVVFSAVHALESKHPCINDYYPDFGEWRLGGEVHASSLIIEGHFYQALYRNHILYLPRASQIYIPHKIIETMESLEKPLDNLKGNFDDITDTGINLLKNLQHAQLRKILPFCA